MAVTIELVQGLPQKELFEKIYSSHRMGEVAQRSLGFYLKELHTHREYWLGFRSVDKWAEDKLSLKGAGKLIMLETRL